MDRSESINRKNTYLPTELLKIVLFSKSKERSDEESMWLTNTKESNRGVFRCSYSAKKTSIIVFPRWVSCGDKETSTVAVEALLVFAADQEEFNTFLSDLNVFSSIPIKIIVTENEDKGMAELAARHKFLIFKKDKNKPDTLRDFINSKDEEEYNKIKSAFMKFDSDNSGLIEQEEMADIARFLGENPDTEDFKEAMLALDKNNDGEISITEFVSYWKIGRQNTKALPKIYHLKNYISSNLMQVIDFPHFVTDVAKIKLENNLTKSTQTVGFIGAGAFKWRSYFDMNVCIGGVDRVKRAETFLSKYSKNPTSGAKFNWISVLFNNIDERICNSTQTMEVLNGFKDNIVKWCDDNKYESFSAFVKNLLIFESIQVEKSAVIAIRIKVDVEELVRLAIEDLLFIISSLAPENQSHEFVLSFKSNMDFHIDGLEGKTVGQFLEICDLTIKNIGFRDRVKNLVSNLNKSQIEGLVTFIQFLFVPYNFNIKYSGNINEFIDESTVKFLNLPMTKVGNTLDFFVKNLSKNLLKSTNDISIAINAFDIYASLKFYCHSFKQ